MPARVSVDVRYPKVNQQKTREKIHQYMTDFTISALGTWVTQATQPIPVWSGAARATFLKLAHQARVSIEISPIAPSRIPLGISESTGVVIAEPGKHYGWVWETDLPYMQIIEEGHSFIEIGLASISHLEVKLPPPVFE